MSIVMTACVVNYIDGGRFLTGIVYKKKKKFPGKFVGVSLKENSTIAKTTVTTFEYRA